MKKQFTLFFLLTSFYCFGQKETNIWFFGYNAGLDFNSGSPQSLSGGQVNTSEGSASISDTAGNLLFSTDGITVWNANNQIMSNGYGLFGGYSSTQSALIVPLPGSDSIYYIFTTGEQLAYGLYYSIVDMSLQSGLGEVTTKNAMLDNESCEKITAVCHSNGSDIWVIAHDWGNNEFQAYLFTSSGVSSTPVTSDVGSTMNGYNGNTIGYLKGSPKGDRLALAVWSNNYFELFDFDKSTGEVSHDVLLQSYQGASSGAYGVEFSPDGSRLYGSVITPGYIYQWNLDAGSDSAIKASKTLVGTSAANFNGALQLASDGKIYMAELGVSWLGVINYPDSLGTDCDYDDTGYQLDYGSNGLGLPNIYPCFFEASDDPQSQFAASSATLCEKFCTSFFDSSLNDPVSWEWIFEGGSPPSSTNQNPLNICYDDPGTYDVTLITTGANGMADTLTLADYITVFQNPFAPVITQDGNVLTSSFGTTYQWNLNGDPIPGATDQSYEITESGLYTVAITDENGCVSQSSYQAYLVGIEDVNGFIFLTLHSNLSQQTLFIEVTAPVRKDATLAIFNVLGQPLWMQSSTFMGKQTLAVDISHLAAGTYFLSYTSNEKTESIKWLRK